MGERKFFSGLPQSMDKHGVRGPDRMRTQFYWPDDENAVAPSPVRRMSRSNNRDDSAAWECASQYEDQTAGRRDRKNKQMQSRIEFYDYVEPTRKPPAVENSPPVNGEINHEVEVLTEQFSETKIEDKPPKQRSYEYDDDSDEEYYERKQRASRTQLNRIRPDEFEMRRRSRPRPVYTDYDDEFVYPIRTSSRERFDLPPRRYYHEDYARRERPLPRRMAYDYPDYQDTPARDFEPIDRDFYYEEPPSSTSKPPRAPNGMSDGVKSPPPPAPLKSTLRRAMSICSDAPSEVSRAMSRRHLKSNIFFNDKELLEDQPRPRTIRESAAMSKVCVGLPDIE